jgi:FkbM family methyltransferase
MLKERTQRLLARLGPRRLGKLERQAQLAQGKGWGSETVSQEVAAIRELLGAAADGPLVVVDVGANMGAWTREALRALPQATVHAFEPSEAAFAALSSAFEAEPRVSLHRLALGDSNGQATLYTNDPGSGIASLTKRRLDHIGVEMSEEEKISVRTLASWADEAGLDAADVLKLDVEGHELDVIRGAGHLLDRVRVLQFEFGGCNIDTRTYFQDFWYLLTDAGFRLYRLGPTGLRAIPEYSEYEEVFVTTNFFAGR